MRADVFDSSGLDVEDEALGGLRTEFETDRVHVIPTGSDDGVRAATLHLATYLTVHAGDEMSTGQRGCALHRFAAAGAIMVPALRRQDRPLVTKREVVKLVLDGKRPPYVPWSFGFTKEARANLERHYGAVDIENILQNHLLKLGSDIGFFEALGDDRVRDVFGVVWDRRIDKDIGITEGCLLSEPTLAGYRFPDPLDPRFFANIPDKLHEYPDRFRVFQIGFSLYERAWTLRGIQNLMMDFYDHPGFVDDLLNSIADYNIAQIKEALTFDIDAVYFGDDWGQQRGLQMGPVLWRKFIKPVLRRMYDVVHEAGKYVFIHSCGDVDELFDDLIEVGVNCFNPFQPEVMDTTVLLEKYRGRLTFHGGLSVQRTLPSGTVQDVQREAERLLQLGRLGSYIFSPSHDVTKDVPLENMLAFIELAQRQSGLESG